MYQYEFFDEKAYKHATFGPRSRRKPKSSEQAPADFLGIDDVELIRSSYWAEHCLECGEPQCYSTCEKFVERPDSRCRRFAFGIYENPAFKDFPYSAEIAFREWGKLESIVYKGVMTPEEALGLSAEWAAKCAEQCGRMGMDEQSLKDFPVEERKKFENSKYGASERAGRPDLMATPTFLLQLYSFEQSDFVLFFDITDDADLVYREGIRVSPGYKQVVLDVSRVFPGKGRLRMKLYPENNKEARIALLFCELVKLKGGEGLAACGGAADGVATTGAEAAGAAEASEAAPAAAGADAAGRETGAGAGGIAGGGVVVTAEAAGAAEAGAADVQEEKPAPKPAKKVKCVAWDLDNTLWDGIFIESDPDALELRPGVLDTMQWLDQHGVIQIAVSKNTEEEVKPTLERLGVLDLFVGLFVNWQPKSQNIADAASMLNINVDTFALIDDSVFEREEVRATLPMVRTYDEKVVGPEGGKLAGLPEFDAPVTAASGKRREMYQTEMRRQTESRSSGVDPLVFLRSCELTGRIVRLDSEETLLRGYELLQRTNQLNLSGHRYEKDVFYEHVRQNPDRCLSMFCSDRFGDYGQVLYLEADPDSEPGTLVISEYALSCRVAQKCVEAALANYLLDRFADQGVERIELRGTRTDRNGLLLQSFCAAGFVDASEGDNILLRLESRNVLVNPDVVKIVE